MSIKAIALSPLPLVEHTPDGDQFMLEGFTHVGLRERLLHLGQQPMRPACVQRLPDFGLFDSAQFNQMDLLK